MLGAPRIVLSGSGARHQNYDQRSVEGYAQHGGTPQCGGQGTCSSCQHQTQCDHWGKNWMIKAAAMIRNQKGGHLKRSFKTTKESPGREVRSDRGSSIGRTITQLVRPCADQVSYSRPSYGALWPTRWRGNDVLLTSSTPKMRASHQGGFCEPATDRGDFGYFDNAAVCAGCTAGRSQIEGGRAKRRRHHRWRQGKDASLLPNCYCR